MKASFSQPQHARSPPKQYPQAVAQSQPTHQPSPHGQQRQQPAKNVRPPPGYGQGSHSSGNTFIKGAGSMVGANKRLMGPRSGGPGPLDPSGGEYHQQAQDASGTSSNPIKIGGPHHLSQEPTVYKHHLQDSGHRVKKQLFQGDDRQGGSSNMLSR